MTDSPGYATRAEDTAEVKIYPPEEVADEWRQEAEEHNRSLSKHLQKLIYEARSFKEHGLIGTGETSQKRVQELEEKVARLEKRLQQKESESTDAVTFNPETLKQEVLTGQYQELEDILRNIVESGILDDALRQPVENQLYFLAAEDEVEYERGWGWKLKQGGDE
ncbi:hypothetical protein SAMN05443574_103243 [Haloarcula vallismortis]|uniref:Uncharacterized protein n=2 Tax=Haloarcula vallismortis TaxID=28442 RepID=M0JV81_HALVA|nr:hypothetical protein [Haloarcula vallismortis]EMA11540.1 hypothetical protein C437_01470 [Haloarcula vallismortis ATCC 29715]SDW44093.1 hypothetical protein SAMN05443574_103243 [Haloarcula vallismortis]